MLQVAGAERDSFELHEQRSHRCQDSLYTSTGELVQDHRARRPILKAQSGGPLEYIRQLSGEPLFERVEPFPHDTVPRFIATGHAADWIALDAIHQLPEQPPVGVGRERILCSLVWRH